MMTPQQETLLKRYADAVIHSPPHLHLTADRDLKQFWVRHVLDALTLLGFVPQEYKKLGVRILDVGSGNGIPGIPIAIATPEWSIELLDSDNKKCGFLDVFCKSYAIKNVKIIAGRAEALAQGAFRERYEVVFARALGKLRVTIELAGAFVAVGGMLIVPHGTSWESELSESLNAISAMGLTFLQKVSYPLENVIFHALLFKKSNAAPEIYPRPIGVPDKKPL
jgi:16S rRNA (guanine527-N7)-methyltransferase